MAVGSLVCWVCGTSLWIDWPRMRKGRRRPFAIGMDCPCCGQRYDVTLKLTTTKRVDTWPDRD
jgi:hypothetical protein